MSEYYSKSTIESFLTYGISSNCMLTPANAMTILNAIPTVDAEPIVRCKDCERRDTMECPLCYQEERHVRRFVSEDCAGDDNWFCANGEKRNE